MTNPGVIPSVRNYEQVSDAGAPIIQTTRNPDRSKPPEALPGPGPERLMRAGHDAFDRHRLAAAVEIFHEAGTVAAEASDPERCCEAATAAGVAGIELGLWLDGLGRRDGALAALRRGESDCRRALGLARRLARADRAATANAALALAAVALGRADDGHRRAQVALADARSAEQHDAELLALLAAGGAAWRRGDVSESLRILTVAERNAVGAGNNRWLLELLREQLRALESDGSIDAAYALSRRTERVAATLVDA